MLPRNRWATRWREARARSVASAGALGGAGLAPPEDHVAPVSLLWWAGQGGRNLGDALSPCVVRAVSGAAPGPVGAGPAMLAVGSIVRLARPGDVVWGAGLSRPAPVASGVDVRAVRGPLTRAELVGQGLVVPEVFGDPALLLRRIVDRSAVPAVHDAVTVPHYVDAARARREVPSDLPIVDILGDVCDTLRALAGARLVYSSSLHGIVCAEALGVPAIWVRFGAGIPGDGFKFRDYYLASGREPPRPLDWSTSVVVPRLPDPPPILLPDLDALLAAWPDDRWPRPDDRRLPTIRL